MSNINTPMKRRKSERNYGNKEFIISGRTETCKATGYDAFFKGEWWGEFADSQNETHYSTVNDLLLTAD